MRVQLQVECAESDSRQFGGFVVEKEKDLWNNESHESARIFLCNRKWIRVNLCFSYLTKGTFVWFCIDTQCFQLLPIATQSIISQSHLILFGDHQCLVTIRLDGVVTDHNR